MQAEMSYYSFINVNATYFTSTPTVLRRRIPNSSNTTPPSALAARWAGVIPQQKNRPAGRVLPAVQNQNPPSRKRHVKRAIFLFNHTNFTIFCMRP